MRRFFATMGFFDDSSMFKPLTSNCLPWNLLLAPKMIKTLNYLRDFWDRIVRVPLSCSQACLEMAPTKQSQPQNWEKWTVTAVIDYHGPWPSPWTVHAGLFLSCFPLFFLSTNIGTMRHPRLVKNSSFEGQCQVKKILKPAQHFKVTYPSIKLK